MSLKMNPFINTLSSVNLGKDSDKQKEEESRDNQMGKRCVSAMKKCMDMAEEEDEKGNKEMAMKHRKKAKELAAEYEKGESKKLAMYESEMSEKSMDSKKLQEQLDELTIKLDKYNDSLNEIKLGISSNNDKIKDDLIKSMEGSIKTVIDSYLPKGE